MAIYPGAVVKIVARFKTLMTSPQRMNLHIAVSEADSLFGYFNKSGNPCSHFYIRRTGVVEQYVDTRYRAAADLEGNPTTISVETQGGAAGQWTAAQVEALARLWAWARVAHGLADQMASDSVPGATSRGLSWHRLGIDPWRRSGGLRYSSARGKVCPGDARIAQIPEIFRKSHSQPEREEDIMASLQDLKNVVNQSGMFARTYRARGQEHAWFDLGTCRRWANRSIYEAVGKPPIIDLPVDDPFWDLPVVGRKP